MAGMSAAAGSTGAAGAVAAGGAGGGSAAAYPGDAAADGGPFCSQPLQDCAHLSTNLVKNNTSYCTLAEGVAAECDPCSNGAPTGCLLVPSIIHGAHGTYLDILNVDVDVLLVYDTAGTLIAVLGYSANLTKWSCIFGPSDFDPTEATSTYALAGIGGAATDELRAMCAAHADGGANGS